MRNNEESRDGYCTRDGHFSWVFLDFLRLFRHGFSCMAQRKDRWFWKKTDGFFQPYFLIMLPGRSALWCCLPWVSVSVSLLLPRQFRFVRSIAGGFCQRLADCASPLFRWVIGSTITRSFMRNGSGTARSKSWVYAPALRSCFIFWRIVIQTAADLKGG